MQKVPPARESFARVFAVNQAVEGSKIIDVIALAATGTAELACIGEGVLHAFGRCRMARKEIDAPWPAAVPCLEICIALHVGEKSRCTVGIEPGARRDSDTDAVSLEFLCPREGGQRQLRLRE